jgi:hypothetical protein
MKIFSAQVDSLFPPKFRSLYPTRPQANAWLSQVIIHHPKNHYSTIGYRGVRKVSVKMLSHASVGTA